MKKQVFTGAATALITPFTPAGEVDYNALDILIESQIAGGIDALVTCGTTGESAVFTDEEHVEVMRYTVTKVGGRVPVVAGVGSNDTRYAADLSRAAKAAGADALLHVTPYYNKTSQKGLVKHFCTLADTTDLPVILYNVPSRTGLNILPATYKELSAHPNIVATKEAGGDISAVAHTLELCGDNLAVYSGNDDQIVPILALGGIGVISVLSNILPRETHNICEFFFDGRIKESRELQLRLIPFIASLFCDVNPIPVKYAMNLLGMPSGPCRLPLVEPDETKAGIIKNELLRLGLLK